MILQCTLGQLAEQLTSILALQKRNRAVLFIDDRIKLFDSMDLPFSINWIVVNAQTKRYSTLKKLIRFSLQNVGLNRNDLIVAIGGGSLCDLVGFMASIIFRGIPWISVPSTFLAQIDAGIGGKVGIDFLGIKNVLGQFHLPLATIFIEEIIQSYSTKIIKMGMGELIKYAFLNDGIYKLILQKRNPYKTEHLCSLIYACAQFKESIIKDDLYDLKNIRIQLNLGHTFGHMLEKLWKIPHGLAVLYGLYIIIHYFTPKEHRGHLTHKWQTLINHLKIPPIEMKQVVNRLESYRLLMHDKKTQNAQVVLVLPNDPDGFYLHTMKITTVMQKLEKALRME